MKIDIEFNSGAQLPMNAIPDLACLAEKHGFDCAWGGEANNKDPTVMLQAALQEAAQKAGVELSVEDGAIFITP